jgi:predicted metal-dependent phosphoesterase TrpH
VIDLHTHTTASDGTDTPAELVEKARTAGLEAIAVTDHDTMAGYDEAPRPKDLIVVAAVELSVRGAHLLGYFFDEPAADFRPWLARLKEKRRQRNAGIAERLQARGVDVRLEEAEALAPHITGRAHFARLLLDKGYVSAWEDAFRLYLGEDAPCFVQREDPSVEEGIERLRNAGAVVSLAHPVRVNSPNLERTIAAWTRTGLQGLEALHPDHSAADTARYLSLAAKYGLAVSAGSDYHGRNKPEVELGSGRGGNVRAGSEVLEDLHRRAIRG